MINRTRKWLYIAYSVFAYLVPMAILIGAKHGTYFKTKTSTLTISFTLVLVVILIVLKNKIAKFTQIPLLIGHIAVIVALLLPKIVADELILALSVSLVGIVLSCIFDRVAEFYRRTSYNPDGTLNRTPISQKQAWAEAYCLGIKLD